MNVWRERSYRQTPHPPSRQQARNALNREKGTSESKKTRGEEGKGKVGDWLQSFTPLRFSSAVRRSAEAQTRPQAYSMIHESRQPQWTLGMKASFLNIPAQSEFLFRFLFFFPFFPSLLFFSLFFPLFIDLSSTHLIDKGCES